MARNPTLMRLLDVQQVVYDDIKSGKHHGATLSRLGLAYCHLEERIRIARMKPLPKSIDVSDRQRRRVPKPQGFTEAPDPGDEPTLEDSDATGQSL